MYDAQILADRIKLLTYLKGKSISQMQKDLNFSANFVSKLNKQKSGISSKNLYELAVYLHCSADFLLGLSNQITKDLSIEDIQIVNHKIILQIKPKSEIEQNV